MGLTVHVITDNYATRGHNNVEARLAKHPRFTSISSTSQLDGGAQVADLGQDTRQGPRVAVALAVLFDHGPKGLVPVQGCPAYAGIKGNSGESDRLTGPDQLRTGLLHPGKDLGNRHAEGVADSRASRRATKRRWRAASSSQPRASASAAKASWSTRWAPTTEMLPASLWKFGHCSQMFTCGTQTVIT
jgi:hypothetical protein